MEQILTNEENGAGATLDINSTADGTTGITAAEQQAVAGVAYYNMNGTRLAAPQRGVNIVKITYSDGKTVSRKVMR